MTQETVYVTNFSGRVGIIYHLEFQSSRGFKYCRRKAPPVWDPGIVLSFHSPIIWAHFWNFGTKTDTVYSTSHLNSEIFEWQKALFFTSLNWVAFIHNGRFQIIDVIEGYLLIESFFLNSLWFVFYRDICLTECEEIWNVRWWSYPPFHWEVKNQFCTSVSTPVYLKSTESVHLLELLIPSLPSRDPLSQKLNIWKGQILSFRSQKYPNFCNRGTFAIVIRIGCANFFSNGRLPS